MYNFARGHPNGRLLPFRQMQEILSKLGSSTSEQQESRLTVALNYPKFIEGDNDLLNELISFMNRHTRDDELGTPPFSLDTTTAASDAANLRSLFLTQGVSHGLDLLCATQTQPGDVVLIERPSYFLASSIFSSHGLKVQSLPMRSTNEGGGVDVQKLVDLVESGDCPAPRMIYIIPTNQNPTARTMNIQDRWKLASLAVRYGIIVAADEVYHLLDWRNPSVHGPRPARMAVLGSYVETAARAADSSSHSSTSKVNDTRLGCCVTVSSFTKIFAPGVRCGWIEGPSEVVKAMMSHGYIRSQGGCVPYMGELLRVALSDGACDQVLSQRNDSYEKRSQLLCRVLKSEPRIVIDTIPTGGYFIWVSFPFKASSFLEFCIEKGIAEEGKEPQQVVKFLPGKTCDCFHGDQNDTTSGLVETAFENFARLCFADMDVDQIEKGAELLVLRFQEFMLQLES